MPQQGGRQREPSGWLRKAAGSRRDAAEGCALLLGRAPQRARVLPRLLSAQSGQGAALLENSIVLLWKRQCN